MQFTTILKELLSECDTCDKPLSEGLQYHIDNNIPLTENIYRPSSIKYFELFKEAKELYKDGKIDLNEEEAKMLVNTNLGEIGIYNGIKVPLDFPMSYEQLSEAKHQGKEVQLNKPKRSSGPKKYVVFVKTPKGNVKKINFGDAKGGLKSKINDKQARISFSKRHDCPNKKDKTKPGYWACRLPRYSALLGLKSNFSGYW
jgi:hypothetical protein